MDDKKKKMVIGALIAAILGIGAFQFTSGGSEEPAPVTAKVEEVKKPDVKLPAPNEGPYVEPLAARDPFKTAKLSSLPGEESKPQEQPKPTTNNPPRGEIQGPPIGEIPWDKGGIPGVPGDGGNVPVRVQEPQFGYVLTGVLVGDTPAAVFADAAGNQRLITVGGSFDSESKLLSISEGKAVVKFGKKTITLTIGGTASAK